MAASNAEIAPGEVTLLLNDLRLGDKEALGRLIPLVYQELRRIAGRCLRAERAGHTLQPTALVHEAYLRLAEQDRAQWQNRAQFLAVAARLMRRILINYAQARSAVKRGSGATRMDLADLEIGTHQVRPEEILAVDEALGRLTALDPQQAQVVELRYFAGLTIEETAEAMNISPRTVKRDWTMASAWLRSELSRRAAT